MSGIKITAKNHKTHQSMYENMLKKQPIKTGITEDDLTKIQHIVTIK